MSTSFNAKGTAPHLSLLASEPVKALLDLAGLARSEVLPRSDDLKATPRGNGEPILVLPGLATADSSTAMLRRHLNLRGYSAHPWKRGLNRGPHEMTVEQWLEPVVRDVERLAAEQGQPVVLLGWSLGGLMAREISRLAPESTRAVLSLGSPFANPHATNAGTVFELLSGQRPQDFEQWLDQLVHEPPVPTASIYSEKDGVVHWSACIQPDPRQTLHVPLKSCGHFGLVLSAEAIRAVLHTLPELLQLNNISRPPSSRKRQ